MDWSDAEFGEERLAGAQSGEVAESAAGGCARLVEAVRDFAGRESRPDGITCLAVLQEAEVVCRTLHISLVFSGVCLPAVVMPGPGFCLPPVPYSV